MPIFQLFCRGVVVLVLGGVFVVVVVGVVVAVAVSVAFRRFRRRIRFCAMNSFRIVRPSQKQT
jgi:uncharacterized membrane protein